MEAQSLELLDQQRLAFESDLRTLTSRIQEEFRSIAENALQYTELYSESVDTLLNDVEHVMEQLKEFMGRCESLESHLTSLEVLSKQVSIMRHLCEELEAKVAKLCK